jgi:hypothetical protein
MEFRLRQNRPAQMKKLSGKDKLFGDGAPRRDRQHPRDAKRSPSLCIVSLQSNSRSQLNRNGPDVANWRVNVAAQRSQGAALRAIQSSARMACCASTPGTSRTLL